MQKRFEGLVASRWQMLFGAWSSASTIDAESSASLPPRRIFPGAEGALTHVGLKAAYNTERLKQVHSRIAAQAVSSAAQGTPKDFEHLGLSFGDLHRFSTFEAICAPGESEISTNPHDPTAVHPGLARPLIVATVDSAVTCASVAIELDGAGHPPVRKDRVFLTLNVHAAVITWPQSLRHEWGISDGAWSTGVRLGVNAFVDLANSSLEVVCKVCRLYQHRDLAFSLMAPDGGALSRSQFIIWAPTVFDVGEIPSGYLAAMFDRSDLDNDGYLTPNDFARLLRELATRDLTLA